MKAVLTAMIKAHEIQGCIALENSFNKVGLDHVVLVKVASTAVVSQLLGLTYEQTIAALSLAWVDGQSLRTYRHAPNTGSRKSWARRRCDQPSRASGPDRKRLAKPGYPSALTAPNWGFYDVSFGGKPFRFQRPYGSYVMENVLFKISFPAEFHAQSAIEAAMQLWAQMNEQGKTEADIASITIRTHEACLRIIDKAGPLNSPADRDHCIQYMVSVPLIFGRLTAADYEDGVASDPRIDALRQKIQCVEEPLFTEAYHDPEKRSIPNALSIEFTDGSVLEASVAYPIGHRRRREDGIPLLQAKFETNLARPVPNRAAEANPACLRRPAAAPGYAGGGVRGSIHSFDWNQQRGGCTRGYKMSVSGQESQFALNSEQRAVRELALSFGRQQIEPYAIEWDREKHFPVDAMRGRREIRDGWHLRRGRCRRQQT